MWKYLGFRIKELFLAAPRIEIRRALEQKLGKPLVLRRMPLGRGWSLKYLAYSDDRPEPEALVKAASRLSEYRLKQRIEQDRYAPPGERYSHEADVLSSLAKLGLGPEILAVDEFWSARQYSAGRCLLELAPAEIAELLPDVLDALDTAWQAGIFHTDPNAGNVIVLEEGGLHFIDSEVFDTHVSGEPLGEQFRRWSHERLTHSLAVNGKAGEAIIDTVRDYYSGRDGAPLTAGRALELMKPKTGIVEFPR